MRCGPKLVVFVDLVELDDEADGVGVTLLKIVEALRGAEYKGRWGRESWPRNNGLKHVFAFDVDP